MVTIPNQSSVVRAWTEFDDDRCMKPSSYRQRIVDIAEELFKFTMLLRDHSSTLVDRYSERDEIRRKGHLLTQAERSQVPFLSQMLAHLAPNRYFATQTKTHHTSVVVYGCSCGFGVC